MSALIDLTGHRFHRLVVVGRSDQPAPPTRWVCLCDCGETTVKDASNLRRGASKSCGCHIREASRAQMLKHGMSRTPAYRSWDKMIRRCTDPTSDDFEGYMGRGITVCPEWLDFERFYADMGDRPEGTSLDRIDNDGNYEPGNCRWATPVEQANNRRPRRWAKRPVDA